MRTYLLAIVLLTASILSFGQKLEENGITVDLKKYEIKEQEVPMFGKQKMITGTFLIKEGKKKMATHNFLVPIMMEEITHIAVLDKNGQKIFLVYIM